MTELVIQETDRMQRLARMVGLLQSLQFTSRSAFEQDVLFRSKSFTKAWGIFT